MRLVEISGCQSRISPDSQVWSAAFIGNGAARIVVGNKSEHWGAMVSHSDDFGATWTEPTEGNIKFPARSFGTRGGQLYNSNDEGESWRAIAEFLPPILCVKTATVN
jgi:photosystem II stability/assembly factor-like uncharacterized protein